MAKMVAKHQVMLGNLDISSAVAAVDLHMAPGYLDTADLTFYVESISTLDDGTIVLQLLGPAPKKRLVL